MSVKHNLEQWIAQLDYDDTCDISDRQVSELIRNYAALEARCAALAAESAGLKAAHPQPFGPEMMKALDAYEKHQDETPETGMLDAFFILRDSICVDTKTTDAFLAEVRASGVDQFKEFMLTTGYPWEGDYHSIGRMTDLFAAKIRQEAAQ